jgi:hypothetical protein
MIEVKDVVGRAKAKAVEMLGTLAASLRGCRARTLQRIAMFGVSF